MKGKKHTKQEILNGIQKAWKEGIDLRTSFVQKSPYRWLYRSYQYYFKNWKSTLRAAGLSYSKIQDKIKEERLTEKEKHKPAYLTRLRQAYEDGIDLSSSSIQKRGNPNRELYFQAKSFYESRFFWIQALTEADLPVKKIIKQDMWDKKKVKKELIKRYEEEKPLNACALRDDYYSLYKAAQTHFGSLDTALKYAGFDPKKIRKTKSYSKLEIILKIIESNNKGINLNRSSILRSRLKRKQKLKKYVWASGRLFDDGWAEAVETAGIDYSKYRIRESWNKNKVLEEIKRLENENEPLNTDYVYRNYGGLYHAAYRYIGSWSKALEEFGINPKDISLGGISLTKEEIIDKIKTLYKQGQDLSSLGMINGDNKETKSIYHQSLKKFKGSWKEALQISGISYEEVMRSTKHTLEELIEKVKGFEEQGIDLSTHNIRRDSRTKRIYRQIMRRFDSWGEFLDKADIDKDKYCLYKGWENGKGIIEYLKENFDTGVVTGATRDRNFSAAVLRYFGTISNAVKSAGLIYSKKGKITKQMLKDPQTVGILYKYNSNFLANIANKVYLSRFRKRSSLNEGDLVNEAFIKFIEILPQKPAKQGIREFCYKPIYKSLVKLNQSLFKEITFEKEVYLDIYGKDSF